MADFFIEQRAKMVEKQLRDRGIKDLKVLESMNSVPRHHFVPVSLKEQAYDDTPLPIGYHQTISQPYIVALMLQAAKLKSTDIVLEIGTGSGYAAAVLSKLVKEVYSIELIPELAADAREKLKNLGYSNVIVLQGNGSVGLKKYAPFNAILVTAAAPAVSESLKEQLTINGHLIIPSGGQTFQELLRITRLGPTDYQDEKLELVRFVPLKGKQGWSNE